MKKSLDQSINELKFSSKSFREFHNSSKLRVETIIKSQLIENSNYLNDINLVLNDFSWQEWLESLDCFIEKLSTLLITLIYDKMLITFGKLKNSEILYEFLKTLKFLSSEEIKSRGNSEKKNEFFLLFEKVWEEANKISPSTPILSNTKFSFNKLIEPLINERFFCKKLNELIWKILKQEKSKLRLLIPYVLELALPESKKQNLGQVFTPNNVVNYICSENIDEKTSCIIDPACGTGNILLGALDFLINANFSYQVIDLIGIEKDRILVDIAESAINYFLLCNTILSVNFCVYHDDFFNFDIHKMEPSKKSFGKTVILMNPPYTRQELLDLTYKDFIVQKTKKSLQKLPSYHDFPKDILSGRSGLHVYFLVHSTSLLKNGENLGIIIPNSWMDTDYGIQLQHFLLDNYKINSITVSRLKKFISSVEVNTAILCLQKKENKDYKRIIGSENEVKFISIDNPESLGLIKSFNNLNIQIDPLKIKIISIRSNELYNCQKWSQFFKTPYPYLEIIEKNKKSLIEFGQVVNIRRGITSGANDFFYLGKPGYCNKYFKSEWDPITGNLILKIKNKKVIHKFKEQHFDVKVPMFTIEKEYWMHHLNPSEKAQYSEIVFVDQDKKTWVPNYLIKSPKDLSRFEIKEIDMKFIVILIPDESFNEDMGVGIKEYIKWGEEWKPIRGKRFYKRPTCRSRKYWFKLPYKGYKSQKLLCLMTINDRYPFFYNPRNFYFDARLYGIRLKKDRQDFLKFLFLFLNSVIISLQLELLGRSNLGEGGLDIKVYEYALLVFPKEEVFLKLNIDTVKESFKTMLKLEPFSILQEKPLKVKHITDNFLIELFNITPQFLNIIFMELKNIVQMRINKAIKS